MTNSKAKKKRRKQRRELGKDVTLQRGQVKFSTHERVTKTKQETLMKMNKKHKSQFQDDPVNRNGIDFYFLRMKRLITNTFLKRLLLLK